MTTLVHVAVPRVPTLVAGALGLITSMAFYQFLAASRASTGTSEGTQLGVAVAMIFALCSVLLLLYGLVAPSHRVSIDATRLYVDDRGLHRQSKVIPFIEIEELVFTQVESYDGDVRSQFTIVVKSDERIVVREYRQSDSEKLIAALRTHAPSLSVKRLG
jgi:hypothetical protein